MKCFYVPGSRVIIDTIEANGLSSICQESLEQIQQRYPGAEVWELDAAIDQIQTLTYQHYITAPQEITAERWEEMLGILPPMQWRGGIESESFIVSEPVSLDLHTILCRIGERYFEMVNRRSLSHQEVVSLCRSAL